MGNTDNTVMLYSSQSEVVVNSLERDGICFSKQEYVIKKYEESAPIFVAVYGWFAIAAEKYLPKPKGAEYPYWAFRDLYSIEQSSDSRILRLCIPTDEAIFFDMYDWNKILRLQYIGETESDEKRFRQMLVGYGIRRESDIILTNFYPELKHQVQDSWQRLFRHHEKIKAGDTAGVESVQAGLWQLKQEWIV
ncbi:MULTISPECIES: DUF3841 domain-containing protein [Tissierellales]|jgi:hypothetical protein|uniref:DUF3841 domain-containing protein n=1 Tax=Acidilutibacter cellobiosedens TaxID=2507161 RepID=A0A410Q871_9FIRM|nr:MULTISPECIES: DUF3841 domain-containing protein [Tissierellales]MBE6083276.1 DUF3841 domain-containing protein [Tissierellaceae bacterium]QAT60179.1 DUF3841 domain-containing protein [Acidilutibacter cellobiosedens]SCL92491.1 hypothetical protein PP176A_2305 [Sporanaerobacter sp. PP17-6a]